MVAQTVYQVLRSNMSARKNRAQDKGMPTPLMRTVFCGTHITSKRLQCRLMVLGKMCVKGAHDEQVYTCSNLGTKRLYIFSAAHFMVMMGFTSLQHTQCGSIILRTSLVKVHFFRKLKEKQLLFKCTFSQTVFQSVKSIEERTRENLPKRLKGTVPVYAYWCDQKLICALFLKGFCQKNDYSTTVCQVFPYSNIFCRRFSKLKGEYRLVEHYKRANQLLLNKTKQNHYYFLHFNNCCKPLKMAVLHTRGGHLQRFLLQ